MLQDIRDNAQGTIAKIIIAVLIVSLSIWGMDAIVGGFRGEPEVATVNGEEITEREYRRMVQINTQQQLRQMENPDPTLLDEDQIRKDVLESMIQAEVLAQEAGDQGLALNNASVDQLIVGMSQFQVGGEFSQQRFTSFVSNLGMSPTEFRELLKRDYISNQIRTAVVRGGIAPAESARRLLAIQGQSRDFRLLRLDGDSVADQVDVTESDVEQWYEENQSQFMQPESVDVEYLVLSLDDVMDDVDVPEDEVRQRFDQMTDQLAGEERRSAHILIEDGDNARERIETVQQRLEEGADFADLAREFSDDPLSAEQGGDLGYLMEGDLGGDYDEALFSLEEGGVAGPVETDYGTHFIKLLDIRQGDAPDFEEQAPEIREQLAQRRAGEGFSRQRTELADLAFSSEDLEYPAEQFDLELQTRSGVTREINQAPFDHAGLIRQLFSGDVLEDGFNTELIDVSQTTAVVARVTEHHPQKPRPLAEVAGQIRDRLERERTLELLQEDALSILSQLRNGETAPEGEGWTSYDDMVRDQADLARPVLSEVFSLPAPGEDAFTFGSAEVGSDMVVIALSGVSDGEVDENSEEVKNMSQFLAQMNGQQEYQAYVQTLRNQAEVERP
ncbi:SurA N-terminal domain-containing protein [Marinobacter zhanjiangensis]|uniref:Periplasmic chaperone PpiD n=1 Tax=Marinobacter zhanjiangensis TaxID=578215 RepID=A0ABQ3AUM6_9GAMM|nr:SurA N-terminal domain-containing protein [Marinobacter zhanjiangensis]GGY64614.1 peptidylprolyl isomerase [Marinobacter zhanjiangensis]